MLKTVSTSLYDDNLVKIARALDSPARVEILKQLNHSSLNVNEIADRLQIPNSTAAAHVSVLEESGLIFTERQPGVRGHMKLCSRECDAIHIGLHNPVDSQAGNSFTISMPIGNFSDCSIHAPCGIVSEAGNVDTDNDPTVFYNPNRVKAQLIWFSAGYVEYRFPKTVVQYGIPQMLEISFEACSEAPYYRENWPSDMTVSLNGLELATWTCPSDFGERRGILNPVWWPSALTQYGMLKKFSIDGTGSYLDTIKCSDTHISELHLADYPYIALRIEVKEEAKNPGGINLFGEKFGDYPQNINMRIDYIPR